MYAPVEHRESTRAVAVNLEPCGQRLRVKLSGGLSGLQVAEALSELYRQQPEVTRLDMLFDLSEYEGEVEAAHIKLIAAAYLQSNREPQHPCRTAFVTDDPNFGLWAASMSFIFVGREHRAFFTFAEAEAFLDEPLASRAPFAQPEPTPS